MVYVYGEWENEMGSVDGKWEGKWDGKCDGTADGKWGGEVVYVDGHSWTDQR